MTAKLARMVSLKTGKIQEIEYVPPPPPTPEEIEAQRQAEIDALTAKISEGKSVIRALGVKVFQLEKAANPDLTAAQFRQSVRTIIEGF